MATKSGASPDLRLLESQGLRRAFRIIGPHRDRVAYGLLQQPGMYVCMLEKTWLGETVRSISLPLSYENKNTPFTFRPGPARLLSLACLSINLVPFPSRSSFSTGYPL
jgi:hypothetical protein